MFPCLALWPRSLPAQSTDTTPPSTFYSLPLLSTTREKHVFAGAVVCESLGSLAVPALAASLAGVGAVTDAAASRVMKFAQVFLRENESRKYNDGVNIWSN